MAKRMDEQILDLAEKHYWTEAQFKKGELRRVCNAYEPSTYARDRFGQRPFAVGDMIMVLQDDECVLTDAVECMTRHGFMRIRRTVLAQYTENEPEPESKESPKP